MYKAPIYSKYYIKWDESLKKFYFDFIVPYLDKGQFFPPLSAIMDWMFVPPQKSYAEIWTSKLVVSGGESFGR
jgi:hypothetical protein